MIRGIPASPGVAVGKIFILENESLKVREKKIDQVKVDREIKRFNRALKKAEEEIKLLEKETTVKSSKENAEIFQAHLMFLSDPELIQQVESEIKDNKYNAQSAVDRVMKNYIKIFSEMDNEYMRARTADLKDVGRRIIRILMNKEKTYNDFSEEVIVFTDDLTPSDTAGLDKNKVLAFVTSRGSKTSHSAIMARSLGIPAVVGLGDDVKFKEGEHIIVDGDKGQVFKNPDTQLLNKYKNYKLDYQKKEKQLLKYKDQKSVTKDGVKINIAANVGDTEDISFVLKNGAEGIGLFRSEFLFMNKLEIPSEEEQFKVYKKAAVSMGGNCVIIRTLDIGGDKDLPYLNIEGEMNPFLGYRAIRMYFDNPKIYKPQLRAILRASNYGNIKLMFPMISSLEEIMHAKQMLADMKEELTEEGLNYNRSMEVGIMIETPAAALMSDILAREVDFFSLGTNDLIQYTVAADRTNKKVAELHTPYHPAVLYLIKKTVDAAHNKGIEVGMCGEAAADEGLIPFLLGIGLDELSMNAGSILKSRQIVSRWTITKAKEITEKVLQMENSSDIKKYLNSMKLQ